MQQFLPKYELSEADLIEQALGQSLDQKVKNAIALFQQFEERAKKLSAYGFYLADSFGKDSGICRHLLKLAKVEFGGWYNNTTIDPPELIYFGKAMHPDTKWNNTGKHLILQRMVEKAIPPTRQSRWCCSEYKENGGNGLIKIIGIRISESKKRAGLWKQINIDKHGGLILAPIAYWTDKDIWDFTRGENIPYSELYDEGFKRLGCIGCPLAGPTGQRREFARWPKYEALWKEGFYRLWQQWHNVPTIKGEPRFFEKYGDAEGFFKWWVSGGAFQGGNSQCVFEEMMRNT